jgi:pimeloyl-ACP methyl ester carboxylesterase
MPPALEVNGTDIFYAPAPGEGHDVVLIHGAGANHLGWPAGLRRMPQATVYTVDLPGHGRSGGQGCERIEDYARVLMGWMDGLELERVIVIGHSMGGAIAQMLALMDPSRVAGLVLLGTGACLPVSDRILEGLQQDFEETVHSISRWSWGPVADPELISQGREVMQETGPQVVYADFLACDRFDVRDRIDRIDVPALVLTGSQDRMTPPRLGEWLGAHLPDARFSLVPEAGHMLMLERPVEVLQAIEEFFARGMETPS